MKLDSCVVSSSWRFLCCLPLISQVIWTNKVPIPCEHLDVVHQTFSDFSSLFYTYTVCYFINLEIETYLFTETLSSLVIKLTNCLLTLRSQIFWFYHHYLLVLSTQTFYYQMDSTFKFAKERNVYLLIPARCQIVHHSKDVGNVQQINNVLDATN